jgi:hypothetical protein
MNQLPNQNQKLELQKIAAAVNLQPIAVQKTLLILGGFQIFTEGLTEYVSGQFSNQTLVELAASQKLPNDALTAIGIINTIALKKGMMPEEVAEAFVQNEKLTNQEKLQIDTDRFTDAVAQHATALDQVIMRADFQRNRQWAQSAAVASGVNLIDQLCEAKQELAGNQGFLDYVDSVFGRVGGGRLNALGKTGENGKVWVPTMEEYLSAPVLGATPQVAPSLAASNPTPNLPQLTSTSTSNNSETSGSDSSSKLTPQSGNGFGKSPS